MSIFQPFSSPPHDHHHYHHYQRRSLFDEVFLDNGCNPTIFLEGGVEMTRVDDTIGTWSTNYVILVICLVGAFKFSCMMASINSRRVWCSFYFLWTGLGYGLAGVNHQIRQLKTDPNFYVVSFCLTTLGAMSLQYQIAANFIARIEIKYVYIAQLYTMLVSILGLGVIMAVVVWNDSLFVGGYLFGSNIWFILYFGIIRDWMAILGSLLAVGGFLIQYLWNDTCGTPAYDECFQDCILPNPRVFNHNGVFHVFIIAAVFLHLFARFVPREQVVLPENDDDDDEEEGRIYEDDDDDKASDEYYNDDKEVSSA